MDQQDWFDFDLMLSGAHIWHIYMSFAWWHLSAIASTRPYGLGCEHICSDIYIGIRIELILEGSNSNNSPVIYPVIYTVNYRLYSVIQCKLCDKGLHQITSIDDGNWTERFSEPISSIAKTTWLQPRRMMRLLLSKLDLYKFLNFERHTLAMCAWWPGSGLTLVHDLFQSMPPRPRHPPA